MVLAALDGRTLPPVATQVKLFKGERYAVTPKRKLPFVIKTYAVALGSEGADLDVPMKRTTRPAVLWRSNEAQKHD